MTEKTTDHDHPAKISTRLSMTGKCVAGIGNVCITHVHVHLMRKVHARMSENAQSKFHVLQRATATACFVQHTKAEQATVSSTLS